MTTRRKFITLLGGAGTWPLAARAQQAAMPLIAFIDATSAVASARWTAAFRNGLNETGYTEGRNVAVEYHWLEGRYDRLPALLAELLGRRVAVIATPASTPASLAAKSATTTIPIVFGVGDDPVKLNLVANLVRPGGNATGINFFLTEAVAKRLGLLRDLVPAAVRIAVMIDPSNTATAEPTLREVQKAASALGLQIQVFNARTSREIDTAFAMFARERVDAAFVGPDPFFNRRRANLAARYLIPATSAVREYASLGRPEGNATGINLFTAELVAKRLELLRELVPRAARVTRIASEFDRGIFWIS